MGVCLLCNRGNRYRLERSLVPLDIRLACPASEDLRRGTSVHRGSDRLHIYGKGSRKSLASNEISQSCQTNRYPSPLQRLTVPWKSIFLSPPVWAIVLVHGCNVFGYFTVVNQLPTYMKYILNFNIKQVCSQVASSARENASSASSLQ